MSNGEVGPESLDNIQIFLKYSQRPQSTFMNISQSLISNHFSAPKMSGKPDPRSQASLHTDCHWLQRVKQKPHQPLSLAGLRDLWRLFLVTNSSAPSSTWLDSKTQPAGKRVAELANLKLARSNLFRFWRTQTKDTQVGKVQRGRDASGRYACSSSRRLVDIERIGLNGCDQVKRNAHIPILECLTIEGGNHSKWKPWMYQWWIRVALTPTTSNTLVP